MSFLSFSYETQLYNNVIKIYNNTKIVTAKSSIFTYRVVTKGRGPGISPGYSEHGPRLRLF